MPRFETRRKKLRTLVRRAKADALLVTNETNVTYLTGFTGDSSYLLVTPDSELLVTDMRYDEQLDEECPGLPLEVRGPGQEMLETTVEVIQRAGVERLAIEASSMTVSTREGLERKAKGLSLVSATGLVERLRAVKDKDEIDAIRQACMLARRSFEVVRAGLTGAMSEKQIAAELEYQARRLGGRGLSFPPIVGVGPRGALPHATLTDKRVEEADFTLIDWGVNEGLYVSDLTRMVVTGRASAKFTRVYDGVLAAQRAGIEAIRPGATCREVDTAARKVIEKAGFGENFGHGLGHGIGLEVHEAPRLAKNREDQLEPGMIVTVEPGVYLRGWGGIRIEDDVLVTKTGHEVLSDVPKELAECVLA